MASVSHFASRLLIVSLAINLMPFGAVHAKSARISQAPEPPANICADFLVQLHIVLPHTRYAGCSYLPERQGKPLQAVYRVNGQYAATAEAALIRATGMDRLRHSCCQWDAPVRQFKSAGGREFSIRMVSEETLVDRRDRWPEIKLFEILVEELTRPI